MTFKDCVHMFEIVSFTWLCYIILDRSPYSGASVDVRPDKQPNLLIDIPLQILLYAYVFIFVTGYPQ